MSKKKYIDAVEFKQVINECFEKGELTPRALELFQLLIDKVAKSNFYKTEDDANDCKSWAWYNVLRYWKSFNNKAENANPFSYYTSMVYTGLSQGWNILYPPKNDGFDVVSVNDILANNNKN